MKEKINLKQISGRKPIQMYSIDKKEVMNKGQGAQEEKYLHRGLAKLKEKEKKIRLLERLDLERGGKKISEKWKIFKEAGLPVVPTMRKTEDGRIFVTDVTADGSEVYGKYFWHELMVESQEIIEGAKRMEDFLKILEGAEFERLRGEVEKYKNLANQHNLYLPADDPFELVVYPDGTWKIMMLDLQKGLLPAFDGFTVKKSNEYCAKYFLNLLPRIKKLYLEFIKGSPR